jgi:hypothetical protein
MVARKRFIESRLMARRAHWSLPAPVLLPRHLPARLQAAVLLSPVQVWPSPMATVLQEIPRSHLLGWLQLWQMLVGLGCWPFKMDQLRAEC